MQGDGDSFQSGNGGFGVHANGSVAGCVYIKNAGVGAGLGQFHHFCKGDAQLLLHALDDPQTHDVF